MPVEVLCRVTEVVRCFKVDKSEKNGGSLAHRPVLGFPVAVVVTQDDRIIDINVAIAIQVSNS